MPRCRLCAVQYGMLQLYNIVILSLALRIPSYKLCALQYGLQLYSIVILFVAFRIARYKLYILYIYRFAVFLMFIYFVKKCKTYFSYIKKKETLCVSSWVFVSIVLPSMPCFSPVQCVICPA